jgi:hypothetical protein
MRGDHWRSAAEPRSGRSARDAAEGESARRAACAASRIGSGAGYARIRTSRPTTAPTLAIWTAVTAGCFDRSIRPTIHPDSPAARPTSSRVRPAAIRAVRRSRANAARSRPLIRAPRSAARSLAGMPISLMERRARARIDDLLAHFDFSCASGAHIEEWVRLLRGGVHRVHGRTVEMGKWCLMGID